MELMIQFDFSTSPRILFRLGAIKEIGKIASEFGNRVLLVMGKHLQVASAAIQNLIESGFTITEYIREGEPTDQIIKDGLNLAKSAGVDMVVACGGGSSIDTGKAISAMMTNPGELEDYLEVVGKSLPLLNQAAPFIAIPTTAGTGSEVTRNAVIRIISHGIKVSLRGQKIIPRIAIVDPELTLGLPPEVTAYTGMDALTQLIEPYLTLKANPLSDALCLEGMKLSRKSLLKAFDSGNDLSAREDLSLASLFSGIALANSGLGGVHGIAGVIGGMTPAPHGALCARLLPYVFEVNASLIHRAGKDSATYEKLLLIGRILLDSDSHEIDKTVKYLEDLGRKLKIGGLQSYGVNAKDFPSIIEHSLTSSSMKGNPVALSKEQIKRILEKAL
jgi:alcohol dehydrogenase class IV